MMKLNNYELEQICIGDLVYFDDSPGKSNYDEYWEVVEIDAHSGKISIKLTYLFEDRFTTINCEEIRQLLPVKKLKYAD